MKKVSQQDIAFALRLSRPTITSNLNELEETGLIYKNGQIDSDQIGRKAAAYSIVPDYRIAIGVEIVQHMVKIMAIDLYGEKIDRFVFDRDYENTDSYYREICEPINQFIRGLKVNKEQILGIGISMQGLVSPDHTEIIYGNVLECTGLRIDVFSKHLDYPCYFFHDSKSAAICEHWFSPEYDSVVYLQLSYHLGAAILRNGEVINGKHGHSSTVEHIVLDPNGPKCYCGKHGCAETFCSLSALLQGEDEDAFFNALSAGDPEKQKRWTTFLDHLAHLIADLHLVFDTDFILSGYMTSYITEKDIQYLYSKIKEETPFGEESDFIKLGKMPKHSITVGTALPFIKTFLSNLE